ncbi:MAG: hypothetical protein Q9182_002690 [Xanthomendoza sp. 2 TL-2023]
MALIISLLSFACKVIAAPYIALPINSQVPPVARIGKPFHFIFSESTFSSRTGTINYAVADTPAWLQLDAPSRTLSGIPDAKDAGSANFSLVATDTTGSTTMPVTMVVSANPGPGLGIPVGEQLSSNDGYQSPSTILLPHTRALSLSFSPATFVNINHETVYYAMCANNTPLPSWIAFETGSLSFSGTAPQTTSPDELPQTFDIQFTASDVVGFSAAVTSFQITVENHILMFRKASYFIAITQGIPFDYDGLQASLELDGHPIDPAKLRQIHADIPSWMSLDQSTWKLSGVPPLSVRTQNISVTATDVYGEVATTTVVLQVMMNATADLFAGGLSIVNATTGMDFDYKFNKSAIAGQKADLAVDVGTAVSWLRYDQANLELSGRVPGDLQPQDIVLNVTLSQDPAVKLEPLTISIQTATHSSNGRSTRSPSPSASSSSTMSDPTAGLSSKNHETEGGSSQNNARVAAAIAVPVIAACLLLILACFVIARRRRKRTEADRFSERKRKVSRPFPFYGTSDRESTEAVIEKPVPVLEIAPSRAPTIDLPGFRTSVASKRHSWFRHSKGITDSPEHNQNTDSWHQYMQGLSMGKPRKPTEQHYSLIPEEQALSARGGRRPSSSKHRRNSKPSDAIHVSPSKRSRQKKRKSDMSFASKVGRLPSQRMSGSGHGRNTSSLSIPYLGRGTGGIGHGKGGPPGFGRVRDSWRHPSIGSWNTTNSSSKTSDLSSSRYNASERSKKIASSLRSFPRPPTTGTFDYLSQPPVIHETKASHRTSIRAVDSEPPQTYGLPLHAFHKRRARNQHYTSTFFAAGPASRTSSHLNWIHPSHSPVLSPTQSTTSTTSTTSKQRTSRLEPSATRKTHSQSSSPIRRSPTRPRPSPRKRASGASTTTGAGLATLISNAITQRLHSSKSSPTSSQRFGSAAGSEAGESRSPGLGLEEERDEEGNRRWRYSNVHPNPLGLHTPDQSPSLGGGRSTEGLVVEEEEEGGTPPSVLGSRERTMAGRVSLLRGQKGEEGDAPRRVLGGGSMGKRPVSVDNGLVARGLSMRGDLGDVERDVDVAFL